MTKRILALAIIFIVTGTVLWQTKTDAVQTVDFVRDIQPIFKANCDKCHGAVRASSYFRLDTKQVAMRAITAGNSKDSRLLHRILGEGGEARMPMGGDSLKPEQITLIKRWIDEGAVWPDAASVKIEEHWAFVKPVRPAIPATKFKTRNPIDNFVFAVLEKQGLAPAPEADKATLIRRLSLDLIGLPPTPKEIDNFLADTSANAYEKVVDRLLASEHYGERWGVGGWMWRGMLTRMVMKKIVRVRFGRTVITSSKPSIKICRSINLR